ncbi:Uma2 family endonuclease [Streptomyces iconiensis]|uniref:Uma2 family endonuclease n=1 Tax=Streptomyces iconiensis TaxID=1384038 RepID=A0ABT7AAS4_9ACTN|nr:Uma2 family endonuclease [Streptomyces iconiensis]MDJ1138453.1 Uma2 family endonuclease [Streptomyces iconiensis]
MNTPTADATPTNGRPWGDLTRLREETKTPEGCKVEIAEELITVAPPLDNNHNVITHRVQRLLYTVIPDDWGIFQTVGTAVPPCHSLFVPDLAVAPEAVLESEPGNYIPAAAAELVVEVTSKNNANHDRIKKAEIYAKARVPLYLLIDRHAPGGPTTPLYGEPRHDVYRVLQAAPFGEPLHLPAPFDMDLDTKVFPANDRA